MAITITKLKMWKNPGYTQRCVEVPPAGSWKLPAPDYTSSENLRPKKDQLLGAVELPMSFIQVFEMSYLYMEAIDSGNRSIKIFGWIDDIQQSSSSNESVIIRWNPDYWRTFSGSVAWGIGNIRRCNDSTYRRPYQTKPRLMTLYLKEEIKNMKPSFLIVVNNVNTDDKTTSIEYYFEKMDQDLSPYRTPTLDEIFSGKLDDVLGIIPESIIGCWLVPTEISSFFTGNTVHNHNNVICFKSKTPTTYKGTISLTYFPNGLTTDDMQKVVTLNPYGEIESTLPWGMSLPKDLYYTADISPNGVTYYIYADDEAVMNSIANGRYLTVSGLPIPINSNAWSSYAYSGQRDYDREMRNIQRDQQTVSGITSMGQGAIGGAIAGASAGPIGAGAGAVAGMGTAATGTVVNWVASGIFNDRLQNETDKLYSNQTSTLLKTGGGIGWQKITESTQKLWYIGVMKADSVSNDEYDAHIARNGYSVDLFTSVSSFISSGGPLQITSLNLGGNIPPQAKSYIKNILENGVYIVENNPSGVAP